MKVLVVLSLLLALAAAKTRWHELEKKRYDFSQYVQEFKKGYNKEEFQFRKQIFDQNLQTILHHNRQLDKSWKLGVNHMTDWTEQEFKRLNGHKKSMSYSRPEHRNVHRAPKHKVQYPTSLDWRDKGAVTPVKDQGQCGSCWTFASTETIESALFLSKGEMVELSEQQVASCTPNPHHCGGGGGCSGGTAEVAFAGVITYGGISSEWVYPYRSHSGTDYPCDSSVISPAAQLKDFVHIQNNSNDALMDAVTNIGPISISVDASSWSHYESGVYNGCNQSAPSIDHAVQLVGYGVDGGSPYWLVRNSWTPVWGESGYIRIARPATAPCGWDPDPCDGGACEPCPTKQWVCGVCGILADSAYPIISN